MKCISPFKMRERSGKWQEHPSTPFTSVSESCHSSRANGRLSSLTKEHKVSESPDMCQGGGRTGEEGPWPKEPPPGIRQLPLCQEYPVKLHLTASKKHLAVSQVLNLWGRWSANFLSFGFHRVHLFSHLISSPSPLTSQCLFSVANGWARQPPCRPTACQSKLLLTLSSPAQ